MDCPHDLPLTAFSVIGGIHGPTRSRLAAKITAIDPSVDGHKRAEDKSKATAEAMYKECTFAPNTVITKPLTDKIMAAKGKQVCYHCCHVRPLIPPVSVTACFLGCSFVDEGQP